MAMSGAEATGGARPRIAYFTNQYPKVSHSFIRREILALERLGAVIDRYAIRGWDDDSLVDPDDIAEKAKTRFTLQNGLVSLLLGALAQMIAAPGPFCRALGLAIAFSRRAMRPWPYHLIYLAHACRLKRWLDETPADHLHIHFGTNSAEVGALLRALGGPPFSFTVHGPDEFDEAKFLHLDKKAAAAEFVVAISSYTRSQLLRHIAPEHWDKVRVVHCGLEAGFFAAEAPALAPQPRFLCIGRLSEQKGHLILLDGFAKLLETAPEAELVLAGDGPLRALIEGRIAALGLGEKVRITGWISADQVREELAAARFLTQPSLQEGLPVVIMEAMAQGRPVITTYIAGIPELVLSGENGWLVPAGDAQTLAAAMQTALDTPAEEVAAMAEAALTRVAARHSIDREAEKLLGHITA